MRFRVPDMPLALTILWIWIGFVVVSIACYWAVKWMRRRHPPARPEPVLPYARRLEQRYAKQRSRRRGKRARSALTAHNNRCPDCVKGPSQGDC